MSQADLPPTPPGADPEELRRQLVDCASLLRDADHLDSDARESLSEVLRELADHLDPDAPNAELAHLAERSAHLAKVLHEPHDHGLIASARERLEEVAARAETEAPIATGLVRRFMEVLAGIGI